MAVLDIQDLSDGGAVTTQAAAAGDQIPQGSRGGGWDLGVLLYVRNNSATATRDVTVVGLPVVTVPMGGEAIIPVFGVYVDELRDITYSAAADLVVAAVRTAGT